MGQMEAICRRYSRKGEGVAEDVGRGTQTRANQVGRCGPECSSTTQWRTDDHARLQEQIVRTRRFGRNRWVKKGLTDGRDRGT